MVFYLPHFRSPNRLALIAEVYGIRTKKKEYLLWSQIAELRSRGLTVRQISENLAVSLYTVQRLYLLNAEELLQRQNLRRIYTRRLDEYEGFITNLLTTYPSLSSAQVHDHLKSNYPHFPYVSEKTVYNYVQYIRKKHHLPLMK